MRKQEALHSSLQLGDVHDLSKVALHNGQLLGVAFALVLGVIPLQCSQSGTLTTPSLQNSIYGVSTAYIFYQSLGIIRSVHYIWGIMSR